MHGAIYVSNGRFASPRAFFMFHLPLSCRLSPVAGACFFFSFFPTHAALLGLALGLCSFGATGVSQLGTYYVQYHSSWLVTLLKMGDGGKSVGLLDDDTTGYFPSTTIVHSRYIVDVD